jgi:putative transposase
VADDDYRYYLENLKELKETFGIKLYAWCLMTNHVHLVLEPGEKAKVISGLMKRLAGRQSAYVNKLEKRTGTLWEGRFKASAIQKNEYLLACVRYVEMNPVRAGMVAGPRQYKWSSYRERVRVMDQHLLDRDECYLGLAKNDDERIQRYKTNI